GVAVHLADRRRRRVRDVGLAADPARLRLARRGQHVAADDDLQHAVAIDIGEHRLGDSPASTCAGRFAVVDRYSQPRVVQSGDPRAGPGSTCFCRDRTFSRPATPSSSATEAGEYSARSPGSRNRGQPGANAGAPTSVYTNTGGATVGSSVCPITMMSRLPSPV